MGHQSEVIRHAEVDVVQEVLAEFGVEEAVSLFGDQGDVLLGGMSGFYPLFDAIGVECRFHTHPRIKKPTAWIMPLRHIEQPALFWIYQRS